MSAKHEGPEIREISELSDAFVGEERASWALYRIFIFDCRHGRGMENRAMYSSDGARIQRGREFPKCRKGAPNFDDLVMEGCHVEQDNSSGLGFPPLEAPKSIRKSGYMVRAIQKRKLHHTSKLLLKGEEGWGNLSTRSRRAKACTRTNGFRLLK